MNKNEKACDTNNTAPAKDCIANGTISMKFPNSQALNDVDMEGKAQQIASEIYKIGGITWQMKISKGMKPNTLNLYVYCNEQVKDNLWLCKVQFKVNYWLDDSASSYSIFEDDFYHRQWNICRYNSETDCSNYYKHFYGFNSHFWIFPITFPAYYKLEQRPFEIKLEIKIEHVQEKSLPTLDTSLVVNMGEGHSETLLVNKNALAEFSIYFRNLFVGNWNDKTKQDGNVFELIILEDFNIRAFKAMIYSAMTLGDMVQDSNFLDFELATELVKLAIKFDFPMLLNYCEKFLVEAYNCPYSDMKVLKFADKYNLTQLKEHYMNRIYTSDFLNEEKADENKKILSSLGRHTREELMARLDGGRVDRAHMFVLDVAEQFNLAQLKEHCLKHIIISDFVKDLWGGEIDKIEKNKEVYSRLSEATQEKLLAKLDGEKDFFDCPKVEVLEMAEQFHLAQLKEHCLEQINMSDFAKVSTVFASEEIEKNKEAYSRLSEALQEKILAKLDGEKDFCYCPKMDVLEMAEQFHLAQLKEHCLEQISMSDFVKVPASITVSMEEIEQNKAAYSRLSEATQKQLQTKLDGVFNFSDSPYSNSKMAFLEVAEQFNLVQLKVETP